MRSRHNSPAVIASACVLNVIVPIGSDKSHLDSAFGPETRITCQLLRISTQNLTVLPVSRSLMRKTLFAV